MCKAKLWVVLVFTISSLSLLSPSHRVIFREAGALPSAVCLYFCNDAGLKTMPNATAYQGKNGDYAGSWAVAFATQKAAALLQFSGIKGEKPFMCCFLVAFQRGGCTVRGVTANFCRHTGARGSSLQPLRREWRKEWQDPLSVSLLVSVVHWKTSFWNCIYVRYFRDIQASTVFRGMWKVLALLERSRVVREQSQRQK